MRTLAQEAANAYLGKHAQELCYDDNLLYIDHIIGDGDVVDLGSAKLNVYSTPGHTNCSLTFYEPNDKILFLSESCGVYVDPTWIDVSILTGYEQTMRSIELCRSLGAKTLYAPHYGKITDMPPEEYFSLAESSAQAFKDIILSEWGKGRTDDEVMETCRNLIWKTKVVGYEDQPVAAFDANTKAFLSVLKKEFPM